MLKNEKKHKNILVRKYNHNLKKLKHHELLTLKNRAQDHCTLSRGQIRNFGVILLVWTYSLRNIQGNRFW